MGTPEYMAPELIQGCYSAAADVWSAGVVMYLSMCGVPPFWASSSHEVKQSVLSKRVLFTGHVWSGISEECKRLVASMLAKDPAQRITPAEILGTSACQSHTCTLPAAME